MEENKVTSKRKSLIVDQYVTTDLPIQTIIRRIPQEATNPIAIAILQLHECLHGRLLAKTAMKTAQEASIEGADGELAALMLANWAELACRIGRPSEAEALIRRTHSIMTGDTHPAIVAASRFAESVMADVTGNKAERETILSGILATLPSHSPRRKFYSWEMALLLAQQGRGIEAQDELKELGWQCNERFKPSRVTIVRFIDAVETGRVIDAVQYMNQLATVPPGELQVGRINVKDYQRLLALMHPGKTAPSESPDQAEDQPPTWIQIAQALLRRNQEEALRIARMEVRKLLGSFFGTGFEAFGLIRAELSAGHWEGAVRLLRMRHGRGNRHYLDALFMARAERLAGNMALAARHFSDVTELAKHFQAEGRLDFELRLSCEMDADAVAELLSQAENQRKNASLSSPQKADLKDGDDRKAQKEDQRQGIHAIIGKSRAMSELRDSILRFANIVSPVLITGETGTGKELVARALHETGRNRSLPFTAVNCGAITETLLESELFGHERGAFTGADKASKGLFEATGRGTLLLDEIGDISPRLQTSLLRVLETNEVRAVGSSATRKIYCRILAATNAELNDMVERGTFRKDLLYRLQRLEIHVAPLRERREDILSLARSFFDMGRDIGVHTALSPRLVSALEEYDWPGNVRELRNVVERMRLMQSDKLSYDLEDLELRFRPMGAPAPAVPSPAEISAASVPTPAGVTAPHQPSAPATSDPHRMPPHAQIPTAPYSPDAIGDFLRSGRSPLRRRERLLALFREHKRLTRAEIIAVLGISPNTATKDLEALCREKVVVRVEPSASSRSFYFELAEVKNSE
jgi:DNA-binding NtrC family response regulator